jgi:hypothetical protein
METWLIILGIIIVLGWAETASGGQFSRYLIAFGNNCMALGCGMGLLLVALFLFAPICAVATR